ncbi:hypothetical protein AB6869_11145 [Rahnella rivi]|uniref:hypothetical protein n=1 Tax=Rahnella TaxID=34037 RepID=UPI0006F7C50E|nr:hypothetical protein [Rahnella sp. Larv3_ips]KQN68260.1 hypothetical protein ASE99_02560 [Serratia sp. Leaf51]
MTPVASYTGAAVFVLIGIVMIVILFRNHRSKTNSKFLTPGNCLLSALAVVSFVIAIIFVGSSSAM